MPQTAQRALLLIRNQHEAPKHRLVKLLHDTKRVLPPANEIGLTQEHVVLPGGGHSLIDSQHELLKSRLFIDDPDREDGLV